MNADNPLEAYLNWLRRFYENQMMEIVAEFTATTPWFNTEQFNEAKTPIPSVFLKAFNEK